MIKKIKKGQVWIERRKGTYLRILQKTGDAWHVQTTESGGNHTMGEHIIKKRYRLLTKEEQWDLGVTVSTFIAQPAKVYAPEVGVRVAKPRPWFLPHRLYLWMIDLTTYEYSERSLQSPDN
jgi:hypothetical protein